MSAILSAPALTFPRAPSESSAYTQGRLLRVWKRLQIRRKGLFVTSDAFVAQLGFARSNQLTKEVVVAYLFEAYVGRIWGRMWGA